MSTNASAEECQTATVVPEAKIGQEALEKKGSVQKKNANIQTQAKRRKC